MVIHLLATWIPALLIALSGVLKLKVNPFIPIVLLWIGAFVRDRSIFF